MPELKFLTVEHLTTKELARIFSKVSVNRETGCWEWQGSLSKGYGKVWFRGSKPYIHRIIFAWAVGPIPRGRSRDIPVLDHEICDNRRCCNPSHLTLTTHRNNVLRGPTGSGINSRKTHCPRGHLLPTKPNRRNGRRYCVTCDRLHVRSEAEKEYRRQKAQERYYTVVKPRLAAS